MVSDYDAETLALHLANVAEKQAALTAATRARDDHVRAMLRAGAGATVMAGLLGVSRGRVYQIRDDARQ